MSNLLDKAVPGGYKITYQIVINGYKYNTKIIILEQPSASLINKKKCWRVWQMFMSNDNCQQLSDSFYLITITFCAK